MLKKTLQDNIIKCIQAAETTTLQSYSIFKSENYMFFFIEITL